jgi:hypothetical protein
MDRPVICTCCNETVYMYRGPKERVVFKAEYFIPRKDLPAPAEETKLACPSCGERWVAVSLQDETIRMAIDPSTKGTGVVKY